MFDINAYWRTLAEIHQDLQHTDDKPAFFVEHSNANFILNQSLMLDRLRYANDLILISQFAGSEDVIGNSLNNANAHIPGYLFFLKKEADKDFTAIEQAHITLKEIWFDFRTKINQDMKADINFPRFLMQRVSIKNQGVIINGYVAIMVMLSYVEPRCYTDRGKFS